MHSVGTAVPSRRLVRVALMTMGAVYFFAYFQRTAVPGTIFNELQQEWKLSASAIVALGSVFLWIYGAMQLPAGILIDRFGGMRMLLVGGLISAVGATLFPLAPTPTLLYVCRAVAAFGDSFIYLCIVKEIALLFPHNRFVRLTGVMQFCGMCGGVLAMLPFERATHAFGWHVSLFTMGVLMLLVLAANFYVLPKLKHFTPTATAWSLQPLWDILGNRRNWPMFVGAFINFPIYFTLQVGIGKKFIQDFVGLSSKQAATFTLVMMAVSAALSLASGYLLEHTGGRRKPYLWFRASTTLLALALLLLGLFWHVGAWIFLTAYILLAVTNLAGPIGSVVMKEMNDDRHLGQALAFLNTLAYFGVAVWLTLSGTVLDRFHARATWTNAGTIYPPRAYATVFVIFTGLAIISLIATAFIPETRGAPVSDLPAATEIP